LLRKTLNAIKEFLVQNVVIAGFGFMGGIHAQAYSALAGAKVVAVVDDDVARAKARLESIGMDVPVLRDFDEALRADGVDVVDVCVPTRHHFGYVQQALEAGKHVFCEKPFALTTREAKRLVEIAERSGRKVQVGHCIRFWPEYQELESYLKSRRGGRLLSLSLFRRSARPSYTAGDWINREDLSGGAALDLHIHDTDFVLHLLGRPKSVTSVGTRDATGWSHLFTTYRFDELAVTSEGGWNYPAQWGFQMGFEAVFERAVIEFDSRANPTLMITEGEGPRRPFPFKGPAIADSKAGSGNISSLGGYFNELSYFIECLEKGRRPRIATPQQAAESVATVLAEIRSARTGKSVKL
jgi:predicted dehydrogenase